LVRERGRLHIFQVFILMTKELGLIALEVIRIFAELIIQTHGHPINHLSLAFLFFPPSLTGVGSEVVGAGLVDEGWFKFNFRVHASVSGADVLLLGAGQAGEAS